MTPSLGNTLRAFRDRVTPTDVGLPAGGRRRAAGLRREELAALAGISPDYLVRLEQGRATSPSQQVVEALARALRLTASERELLFRLAGHSVPGPGQVSAHIPRSVHRLIDRLDGSAVAVWDAMWNLLLTNSAYEALMGDTTAWQGAERNGIWRQLTAQPSRAQQSETERQAVLAGLLADLRLTAAAFPRDPRVRDLIALLTAADAHFAELWRELPPTSHDHDSRSKVIRHPTVGDIHLDCDTLVVAGDGLKIMVYSAEPNSADAERLQLALVLGASKLHS